MRNDWFPGVLTKNISTFSEERNYYFFITNFSKKRKEIFSVQEFEAVGIVVSTYQLGYSYLNNDDYQMYTDIFV